MNNQSLDVGYEQILDDTNQLIQISDEETFSMMYANKPACDFTSSENQTYRGEKCYKYMMGLEEQCPFCPMREMADKDSFVTEIDNGQQVFTVKTKRIIWEGKNAFIEYATDITTTKRAQKIFESQMQTLIQSIPEAQGIFHLNLTKDLCISTNGTSNNVDQLKKESDVNSLIEKIGSFIPNEDKRKKFMSIFSRETLMKVYNTGKTEMIMETPSYYDDGAIRWARLTARLIMNPNTGDLEAILYGMDINDEKSYQEKVAIVEREKNKIIEKSMRDTLTDVYSKKAFEQMGNEYLNDYPDQSFAIIFVDLDNFKMVNDCLGHLMGDNVIIDVADKLQTIFSNKDIISRFGGDEFCILLKDIPKNKLIDKLQFMLEKLEASYSDEKMSVDVSASIGAIFSQGQETDVIPLIQKADMALYKAKRNGRNQYQLIS